MRLSIPRHLIYLLVFLAHASSVLAQSVPPHVHQRLLFSLKTIDHGLSQGMINDIQQDRYGFMWFSTKDGINQYDGYNFRIYRHDPSDSSSLSESYVDDVFEDSQGQLWVTTLSGYVDRFNRDKGIFEHVINFEIPVDDWINGSLSEDKKGSIIYLRGKVLYRINAKTLKVEEIARLPANTFRSWLGENGRCMYSVDSSLFFFDPESRTTTSITPGKKFLNLLKPGHKPRISYAMESRDAGKRYLFLDGGIIVQNDKDQSIETVYPYTLNTTAGAETDPAGLWIIADGSLLRLDVRTGVFYPIESTNAQHAPYMSFSCIKKDRTGVFWLGTTGYGVFSHDPRTTFFHHRDSRSVHGIREINGRIYVLFEKETVEYKHLLEYVNRFDANKAAGDLSVTEYPVLRTSDFTWFEEDSMLVKVNNQTKYTERYFLPGIRQGINGRLLCLEQDGFGRIWMATHFGLYCFDPEKKNWQSFKHDPGDSSSISYNLVYTVCADLKEPKRILWVGTAGGGLNKLDMETGKFKRYLVKNGLANNVIYGILTDEEGSIWMSTNFGLSRLDPSTERFRNYDEHDGLQGKEFNHRAYLKASDNSLYFGGVHGFNNFHPTSISFNPVAPKVVITDLRIRNKSIDPDRLEKKGSVYLNDRITLPYEEKMITLAFAALDFSAPSKNQYQYIMEGFDDDWIQAGPVTSATYTNLDPGQYTFRVKGSNKDGIWSEEEARLIIKILPPWYEAIWFRVLMALLLAAIFYLFYRYRVKQAEEMSSVRNRIARDLHDEIGSNLSNISIFSNVAQQIGDPEVSKKLLEKISYYSQNSQESMSDIVWMINADNDKFQNIMTHMRRYSAEVLETMGCITHVQMNEKLNDVKLNMEERKNFYLIYKEAINNIAKYSQAKEVWIELDYNKGIISLRIRDNGVGFDVDAVSDGNGLINVRSRAAALKGNIEIVSVLGKGTDMLLQFPA